MNWMTFGGGLLFLAAGGAAYRGRWRSWLGKGAGYTSLGLAWLGAAFVLLSPAALLVESRSASAKALTGILLVVAAGCLVVGALSPFWMWWRLLPQWVRTAVVAYPRLGRPPRAGQ